MLGFMHRTSTSLSIISYIQLALQGKDRCNLVACIYIIANTLFKYLFDVHMKMDVCMCVAWQV